MQPGIPALTKQLLDRSRPIFAARSANQPAMSDSEIARHLDSFLHSSHAHPSSNFADEVPPDAVAEVVQDRHEELDVDAEEEEVEETEAEEEEAEEEEEKKLRVVRRKPVVHDVDMVDPRGKIEEVEAMMLAMKQEEEDVPYMSDDESDDEFAQYVRNGKLHELMFGDDDQLPGGVLPPLPERQPEAARSKDAPLSPYRCFVRVNLYDMVLLRLLNVSYVQQLDDGADAATAQLHRRVQSFLQEHEYTVRRLMAMDRCVLNIACVMGGALRWRDCAALDSARYRALWVV